MAKAPRRRGRGPRRSGKGKPAKPVRPKAVPPAQPVQPPVAKPAQPVRPAAAKPAPAKPAKAARPAARGRAREEEIGGRHRARAASGGGGMNIATKVGLITGALALAVAVIAVLASSSGGGQDADASLNEVGYRVVGTLSSVDPGTWVGETKTSSDGYKEFTRHFKKLFGEEKAYYFDDWVAEITDTSAWEQMDPEEKEAAQARLNAFNEYKNRLEGGGSDTGGAKVAPGAAMALASVLGKQPQDTGTQVLAAWIRKGMMQHGGEWVVGSGSLQESQIGVPEGATWMQDDNRYQFIDGTYTDGQGQSFDVRIFASGSRAGAGSPVTTYAAVWQDTAGGGSGGSGAGLGLGIAVIGAIAVGVLASMIAGQHTQGIRTLAREIDRLGTSGDPTRQLHAHGAEATAVARAVEKMVGNLEFRSKHDDQDLDEVVSREEKVAREIHGALISKNPPSLMGYEVETLFKPGFEIGGDHFEYFDIDDNHLGVILLDTNVRGVPAALVMAQAKAYVRAAAPQNLSPAEVLRHVNRNLAGELPPGRHVTALYAVIDTQEGRATIASAGHLPLIVYRHSEGKVFKVNPEGIALGLDKGTVFDRSLEEGDIPIGVGDRIVLYTDGALKVQNEHAEEFGEQRFYQSVAREAPKNSQAFVNFVGSAIDQFHLNAPQNDDITISTVKRLK